MFIKECFNPENLQSVWDWLNEKLRQFSSPLKFMKFRIKVLNLMYNWRILTLSQTSYIVVSTLPASINIHLVQSLDILMLALTDGR